MNRLVDHAMGFEIGKCAKNVGAPTNSIISNWLLKYTNVVSGYQKRWVVVYKKTGILKYYEKNDTKNFRARGYIDLTKAVVEVSQEDLVSFAIVSKVNTVCFRFKCSNIYERRSWISLIMDIQDSNVNESKIYTKQNLLNSENFSIGENLSSFSLSNSYDSLNLIKSHYDNLVETADNISNLNRIQNVVIKDELQDLCKGYLDQDVLCIKSFAHSLMESLSECQNVLYLHESSKGHSKSNVRKLQELQKSTESFKDSKKSMRDSKKLNHFKPTVDNIHDLSLYTILIDFCNLFEIQTLFNEFQKIANSQTQHSRFKLSYLLIPHIPILSIIAYYFISSKNYIFVDSKVFSKDTTCCKHLIFVVNWIYFIFTNALVNTSVYNSQSKLFFKGECSHFYWNIHNQSFIYHAEINSIKPLVINIHFECKNEYIITCTLKIKFNFGEKYECLLKESTFSIKYIKESLTFNVVFPKLTISVNNENYRFAYFDGIFRISSPNSNITAYINTNVMHSIESSKEKDTKNQTKVGEIYSISDDEPKKALYIIYSDYTCNSIQNSENITFINVINGEKVVFNKNSSKINCNLPKHLIVRNNRCSSESLIVNVSKGKYGDFKLNLYNSRAIETTPSNHFKFIDNKWKFQK